MVKAAAHFTVLFQRSKTDTLDVTDDNSERPWDHSYACLLTWVLCYVMITLVCKLMVFICTT